MNGMLFLAGFTFTVVTILLTSLPNPKATQSQLMLLFLSSVFYLSIFVAVFAMVEIPRYASRVPPLTKRSRIGNILIFSTFLLIGLALPLLFLVLDLTLLALVSGLTWLFFAISTLFFVHRPFRKWRATQSDKIKK